MTIAYFTENEQSERPRNFRGSPPSSSNVKQSTRLGGTKASGNPISYLRNSDAKGKAISTGTRLDMSSVSETFLPRRQGSRTYFCPIHIFAPLEKGQRYGSRL